MSVSEPSASGGSVSETSAVELPEQDRGGLDTSAEQWWSPWNQNKAANDKSERDGSLWLLTFADVMALMLTFFVLLYSMSTLQEDKWEALSANIQTSFDVLDENFINAGSDDTIDIERLDMSRALALDYLRTLIVKLVDENDGLSDVVMFLGKDRLVISLPSYLLFDAGDAQTTIQGKKALFSLVDVLSRIRNRVEVIGHADPTPISGENGGFSSNRELSLHRAMAVAGTMSDLGYEREIVARGLSSSRYEELSAELPEDQLLALSRRVDIVVLKNDGSQRFMMDFSR